MLRKVIACLVLPLFPLVWAVDVAVGESITRVPTTLKDTFLQVWDVWKKDFWGMRDESHEARTTLP